MAGSASSGSKRKWVVAFVLLGLFVLIAGGSYWVYRRGQTRVGVYEKASQALDRGDLVAAEAGFRSALKANPNDARARHSLIRLLLGRRDYAEADALAADWIAMDPQALPAWEHRIRCAFDRFQFAKAERLGRSIAELSPELALTTVIRVRETLGTPRDRWEAQKAAAALAAISESDQVKALMLIYAAEMILDVVPDQSASYKAAERQANEYLRGARDAMQSALVAGLDEREAGDWAARMQLLTGDERDRARSAAALEDSLSTRPDSWRTRASLAAHYTSSGDVVSAARHVALLETRGSPFPAWLRGVRRLVLRGHYAPALELVEQSKFRSVPAVALLESQALLRGAPEHRARGLDLLADLIRTRSLPYQVVIATYKWLSAEGRREEGRSLLSVLGESETDQQAQARLAGVLSESPADAGAAAALIDKLARRVTDFAESLRIIELLQKSGPEAVQRFVDAKVEAGDGSALRYRLIRAAAAAELTMRAKKEGKDERAYTKMAREDLRAVDSSSMGKRDLAGAARIAIALGEHRLAGRLLGRAMVLPGHPHDVAFASLNMAARTEEAAVCAEVAEGIREAGARGPAQDYLRAIARAVELRPHSRDALKGTLDQLIESGSESKLSALYLLLLITKSEGELDRAMEYARVIAMLEPDDAPAQLTYGDFLVKRESYEEVLKLYGSSAPQSEVELGQRSTALWRLKREGEALELARAYAKDHPRSAVAPFLAARMLVRLNRSDEALGLLSVAPRTSQGDLLRAGLLTNRGELLVAETLLERLISERATSIEAWRGLMTVNRAQDRLDHFVARATEALESRDPSAAPLWSGYLLALRASAKDDLAAFRSALEDYEAAIELRPQFHQALNNAAVLLAERFGDLDRAKAYVEEALRLAPDTAAYLDSAATVFAKRKEFEQALEYSSKALTKAPKNATYVLNRAAILNSAGKEAQAIELLRGLIRAAPGGEDAARAREMLDRLTE